MRDIRTDTIYNAWWELNSRFIYDVPTNAMLMPGRDFSYAQYHITLTATNGFGIPEKLPPFFQPSKRLSLLAKRYIDPEFWDAGVGRMLERQSKLTGSYPSTSVIVFNRRATKERKVPAGGGCLISINFTWFQKKWHVHILSRASEITARLLGDVLFLEHCVARAAREAQLKKFDIDNVELKWTLLLPSQMKYMVPLFLLYTHGEEELLRFMTSCPKTPWQETIKQHFWQEFIYPDKIKWMQRRKWSEKFLNQISPALLEAIKKKKEDNSC